MDVDGEGDGEGSSVAASSAFRRFQNARTVARIAARAGLRWGAFAWAQSASRLAGSRAREEGDVVAVRCGILGMHAGTDDQEEWSEAGESALAAAAASETQGFAWNGSGDSEEGGWTEATTDEAREKDAVEAVRAASALAHAFAMLATQSKHERLREILADRRRAPLPADTSELVPLWLAAAARADPGPALAPFADAAAMCGLAVPGCDHWAAVAVVGPDPSAPLARSAAGGPWTQPSRRLSFAGQAVAEIVATATARP
jgi:hypothetical protein